MTVEALLGTDRAFAADLVALRPQVGQATSAANLRGHPRRARRSSPATGGRRPCAGRVFASLLAAGARAGREVFAYANEIGEIELLASIDNPTVLPDGRVESVGNFHGAPVAHAFD